MALGIQATVSKLRPIPSKGWAEMIRKVYWVMLKTNVPITAKHRLITD